MATLYGYSESAAGRAHARVVALLEMLADRIEASRARGGRYLLGDAISAPDLYWACFAAMFAPLSEPLCPMPAPLRAQYTAVDPLLSRALRPSLLDLRDRVYAEHLELPLDF
jgi:glutathione S-transferase